MTELTKAQEKEVKKEVHHIIAERVKKESQAFRSELRKQTTTAIIAAFGLVIALSWQTVIKAFIDGIPKSGILLYHPYLTDLYTALIVTIISVAAIMILSRWAMPKAQTT